MSTELLLDVPDEILAELLADARKEFRTPQAHALWLIRDGLARRSGRYAPGMSPEEYIMHRRMLHDKIRELYNNASAPSTRKLAADIREKSGMAISHTSVYDILQGNRVPRWALLERLICSLGGDPAQYRELWASVSSARRMKPGELQRSRMS